MTQRNVNIRRALNWATELNATPTGEWAQVLHNSFQYSLNAALFLAFTRPAEARSHAIEAATTATILARPDLAANANEVLAILRAG